MGPRPNLWETLPAEVRIEIMKEIFDLPTLRNLLIASPKDKGLFNRYHSEIVEGVMAHMPAEIKRIVRRVRKGRYRAVVPLDEVLNYYDILGERRDCLPAESRPETPFLGVDHTAILFSMAEMAESINSFAARFAQQRILSPSGHPHSQLSPAEVHRIQRAFWSFQQLYESNYPAEPGGERGTNRYVSGQTWPNLGPDPGKQWLRRRISPTYWLCSNFYWDFGSPLEWEVKEIDAVREHLRAEVNSVQIDRHQRRTRPDPLHRQPKLIQRLIKDIEHWGTDLEKADEDHLLVADLGEGDSWNYPRRIPDPDTPAAARDAHISIQESLFMLDRQRTFEIYEQWGLCMFDRKRLIRCGLLPEIVPYGNGSRQDRNQVINLLESVKRSHKECYVRLKNGLDSRIQAQFDADVALGKQLVMQSEELKSKERLIKWVKPRDAALYKQWATLLASGVFDKVEQLRAELCHKKVLVMQSLERGVYKSKEKPSEDVDLELLVRMREHHNAQRAVQERILALSEQGSE